MARINIFVPAIARRTFSGGLLTVFEYANGLTDRGHSVTVVPISPSSKPSWFQAKFEILTPKRTPIPIALFSVVSGIASRNKNLIRKSLTELLLPVSRYAAYSYQRALHLEWVRDLVPVADISIATAYETALPTYLYGTGEKYYFCQHYEPIFSGETEHPDHASVDAKLSYHLPGLRLIANSSWLAQTLQKEVGVEVPVCTNAIDHDVFFPEGSPPDPNKRFVVIGYGGRNAEWKGIKDAAEAIQIARKEIPHLEWRVFGKSLLPPDNSIAPYRALGFITGPALRRAYSEAHLLLAPSWYESFPLFPLEAMACGTPVVTTPYGVEDYIIHLENAFVIPPRDPEAMAEAILTLYQDQELTSRLKMNALRDAKRFTWEQSVQRMASLIGLETPLAESPSG